MKIILPSYISHQMLVALEKAGNREIGGILMGEHIGHDLFQVTEVTFQMTGGTFAFFYRQIHPMIKTIKDFFQRNHQQYRRFNYIGEWHSHPSFSLVPSTKDSRSMQEIVDDDTVGANFAVLLLVKISSNKLEGSVNVYSPRTSSFVGSLEIESPLETS